MFWAFCNHLFSCFDCPYLDVVKLYQLITLRKVIRKRQRHQNINIWAPSSEFVSSSIPSWHILTAHAQPFRGARDLPFCLKVPLDSLLLWASSEGSGETARMCRLAWTFAARIGDKYQIRLTRSIYEAILTTSDFSATLFFFTGKCFYYHVFSSFDCP